jgi:hypothetical protein
MRSIFNHSFFLCTALFLLIGLVETLAQEIKVIPHNLDQKLVLSEIATDTDLIRFDYPSSIQPQVVSKIIETEQTFLVFDSNSAEDRFARRVVQFDKKGNFQKEVNYSLYSQYDEERQLIYSPKGRSIEVYNLAGEQIDTYDLSNHHVDLDQTGKSRNSSFFYHSDKLYFLSYYTNSKTMDTEYSFNSYDIRNGSIQSIYDTLLKENPAVFKVNHSLKGNLLVHHNPNLNLIYLINPDQEIDSVSKIYPKGVRKSSFPGHLSSYFYRPNYLIGQYTIKNKAFGFIQRLSDQFTCTYQFPNGYDEEFRAIEDDIYQTGHIAPWNSNLSDQVYSIRYKHPNGNWGGFSPNSQPAILKYKLK